MRKIVTALATAALLGACQPRHPSDQANNAAAKAAEAARARQNAEQDAIQAQRQLDLVTQRNKNNPPKNDAPEAPAPPKK
jgi:hypothetical protein